MRYCFTRRKPPFTKMLVVESGSRQILEAAIPKFRALFGDAAQMDLLTCLPGLPQVFHPAGARVFRVTDCRSGADRLRLLKELRSQGYPLLGIICSDEPVMTLWKLATVALLPAKVLVFNENADFFWLDWDHRKAIRQFVFYRAGLLDDSAVRKLMQLAAFPFLLAFLIAYAVYAHMVRACRLTSRRLRILFACRRDYRPE
jgi:hypothetical protein